ncbi:hypothetical protein Pla123a_20550 [Posidoniimonas polymericola]|uniref:Uncharacterized protein n=1 Tax=Posidoniimonas polymericola TaxID=2528002 RepID=A0A5C5YR26_9BACT|nr:hypothetical protein [Posidoniimonas polymericola]TWT77394.1 hypothetical protein Pla123a_20550 [Posidoniimonas polymericola]
MPRETLPTALIKKPTRTASSGAAFFVRGANRILCRPRLAVGVQWFAAAMVLRGEYNTFGLQSKTRGWLRFEWRDSLYAS